MHMATKGLIIQTYDTKTKSLLNCPCTVVVLGCFLWEDMLNLQLTVVADTLHSLLLSHFCLEVCCSRIKYTVLEVLVIKTEQNYAMPKGHFNWSGAWHK